jgi:hypothetical protein
LITVNYSAPIQSTVLEQSLGLGKGYGDGKSRWGHHRIQFANNGRKFCDRLLRYQRAGGTDKGAPDQVGIEHLLASLSVNSGDLATRAELLELEAVWIITAVLLSNVITLFALDAGHSDLWADIRTLACHRRAPS